MESNHDALRREYNLPEIDRFELMRYIDRGSWSLVFEAKRLSDNSICALKFIDLNARAKEQLVERGWTLDDYVRRSTLNGYAKGHTHIAWNYSDVSEDKKPFLVEEFLPMFLPKYFEETLDSMPTRTRKETRAKTKAVYEIAKGIADGLKGMHTEIHKTHCDLHPRNISIDERNLSTKLSDYGSSSFGIHAYQDVGVITTRAPERFGNVEATPKSDVWSFGSILYRMLTGKYVFEDEIASTPTWCIDNVMQTKYKDKKGYKSAIDRKLSSSYIPEQFRDLLRDCLAHEDHRISDGAELADRLEQAIKSYNASTPLQRLKRYSLATAAAGLVAVAGIGSYGALQADTIRQELAKEQGNRQYEKELRLIKLHQQRSSKDGRSNDSYFDFIERGNLDAVLSRFKDKKTGYAFFLNPDSTAKAIKMAGGSTDYESVKKQIWTFDTDLGCNLLDVEGNSTDNIASRIAGDNYFEMSKKIDAIGKKYGLRLNDYPDGY